MKKIFVFSERLDEFQWNIQEKFNLWKYYNSQKIRTLVSLSRKNSSGKSIGWSQIDLPPVFLGLIFFFMVMMFYLSGSYLVFCFLISCTIFSVTELELTYLVSESQSGNQLSQPVTILKVDIKLLIQRLLLG